MYCSHMAVLNLCCFLRSWQSGVSVTLCLLIGREFGLGRSDLISPGKAPRGTIGVGHLMCAEALKSVGDSATTEANQEL